MIGQFSLFAVLAMALVAESVNFVPATDGDFPYQVSVRINGRHACGGAIVGRGHIVTSAKCVADLHSKDDLVVVTGSLSSTDGGETYKPRKITSHPDFTRDNPGSNDLAVINLERPMDFNTYQDYLFLPSYYTSENINATLTGWRWDTYNLPSDATHLKRITVKTTTTEKCQHYEPTVGLGQICASFESGRGSCVADVGAPLVYDHELIGVLSEGNPCGGGTPGIFTSVKHNFEWIYEMVYTGDLLSVASE